VQGEKGTGERIYAGILVRAEFFLLSFSHFHQDYSLSAIFLSLISPYSLFLIVCVLVLLEVSSVEGIGAESQERW
jgi:hypothetical protein